jgi:hypothetical protein
MRAWTAGAEARSRVTLLKHDSIETRSPTTPVTKDMGDRSLYSSLEWNAILLTSPNPLQDPYQGSELTN